MSTPKTTFGSARKKATKKTAKKKAAKKKVTKKKVSKQEAQTSAHKSRRTRQREKSEKLAKDIGGTRDEYGIIRDADGNVDSEKSGLTAKLKSRELQEIFLAHYRELGHVGDSVKKTGVSYSMPSQWCLRSDWFKEQYELAKQIVAVKLEDAAFVRSNTGWRKPIYWQGALVGFEQRFSDTLLVFLLKGLKPEVYRERSDVNVKATMDVSWTEMAKNAAAD